MAENEQDKAEREERELYAEVNAEIYGQQEVTASVTEELPTVVTPEASTEVIDPWAGTSPALRQMMEGISNRMADLDAMNDRLKQAERRVGSLNNKLAAAPVMPKAPTAEEIAQAAESDEKLQEFLRDFPVHAEGIQALINKKLQSQSAGIPVEEIERMRAELQTDFDQKLDTAQKGYELKLLKSKYKNHREIALSPEFTGWIETQDEETKTKAGGWNALDGIEVLDRFFESRRAKNDLPDITGEREARLDSAAADTRNTSRNKPVRQKTVAEMSVDELYDYEAKKIWGNK